MLCLDSEFLLLRQFFLHFSLCIFCFTFAHVELLGCANGHNFLQNPALAEVLTLTGLALGLVASLGLARLMSSLLFGVSTSDPSETARHEPAFQFDGPFSVH